MYENLRSFFDRLNPLDDHEWDAFKKNIKVKCFKKGELIRREGEIEQNLFFVCNGGVRVFYLKDGNEINVNFRFENQFTSAYASFLTQTPSRQYIAAIEDTKLYAIHYSALQELYATFKNGECLGRLSAESLFIEKEIHEASLMLDSPDERFNSLLEHKKDWIQRIPQKYLASYLNITPETFSRLKKRNT